MKKSDKKQYRVLPLKLQECLLDEFSILQEDDILFIDSTHVSKINSDVNRIFFEILPKLNKGVYIHFHDIFYPFEYPKEYVFKGWSWNENYLLRAFLEYNDSFKIVYFNTYMQHFYKEKYEAEMPLSLKRSIGGIPGSLWLKKIQ